MKEQTKDEMMEFLMTYGWAILASIIAIGILVYFGVFNSPSSAMQNCFNRTAMEYCNNNDMSYSDNNRESFRCNDYGNIHYRERGSEKITFYFLPKEINDCENHK